METESKLPMQFSQLGLTEPFLRSTRELGYTTTTPIQTEAIPVVLSGRDLIGCAQTGTGKTAAFTLPMLDRLMRSRLASPSAESSPTNTKRDRSGRRHAKGSKPRPRTIRALVLAPTRELAAQISDSLHRYGRYTPLRQTVVFGGVSQHHQVKALRHGVDALVATPGRLLDLMEQGYIDLSKIEILIFDEADQMLDMGFLPALERIVSAVPARRQTLMFSATMPPEIRQLARKWLDNPAAIQVGPAATPVERIAQTVHLVDRKRKSDLLLHFLKATPRRRTLVFSRTKHGADKIVKRLQRDGLYAAAIHGNKSQSARTQALAQFKSQSPPVLVATDIAARGLDISDVSHVVNFDLPETPETYVHRIGRTARAGVDGAAVSFCAGDERALLRQIEQLTQCAIEVEPAIAGFEPTDPVRPRTGNGSTPGTARRSNAHKRTRRRSGTPRATASGDQLPQRRKNTSASGTRRKTRKQAQGAAQNGVSGNRRRRPVA